MLREAGGALWRGLLWLHRYLGVAVGLVMLVWCLSGFVMMYHGYPRLAEADRLRGLEPLRFGPPCDPARLGLASGIPVADASVEMLGGRPILSLRFEHGAPVRLDLHTCARAGPVSALEAEAVAALFTAAHGWPGALRDQGVIASDQWTVNGASHRGPVRRLSLDDPAHTDVYVAVRTGEIAQRTTRKDRVLGWLGAVPHWLYPTLLRRNGELWSQVVIWTSLVGVFLTATGLVVGITRLRRYKSGRWSPYRGWFLWHHVTGLVFGVLTLTWVASGLLTMSPWGWLESPAYGEWRARLAGPVAGEELARFLRAVEARAGGAVRYELAPLRDRFAMLARTAEGDATRLDAGGEEAPLARSELTRAVAAVAPAPFDTVLLRREDAFLYAGYDQPPPPLPALRVTLHDRERTALYLDATSGRLLRAVDRAERLGRWTRTALHDWDFPALRTRPLWDGVVLLLLAGVTATCGTGAWLSIRRVTRDIAALSVSPQRRAAVERKASPRRPV